MDSDLHFLQAFGKIFLQANLLIIMVFFLQGGAKPNETHKK
jgi:hypothetical protein